MKYVAAQRSPGRRQTSPAKERANRDQDKEWRSDHQEQDKRPGNVVARTLSWGDSLVEESQT